MKAFENFIAVIAPVVLAFALMDPFSICGKAEFSTTLETGIIIGKKEDLPMEPRMELINSVLAAMTALLAA
ncbi:MULTISPECIES: hypothetical protein, partial [Blautia]|uniref:hypothetical protein n=1 Tax=Blautia TaxID=572511 RepID=UPI00197AECA0